MVVIQRYQEENWDQLRQLMLREGEDWSEYTTQKAEAYFLAVRESATFLSYSNEQLVGFCRCRIDGDFGVYIYDLLVDQQFRGRQIAQQLMEHVCKTYPDQIIYVMSDVDGFYESKGYRKEGSIFEVKVSE